MRLGHQAMDVRMSGGPEQVKQTLAAANATGTRHCSNCYAYQNAFGGSVRIMANGARRWVCASCTERRRKKIRSGPVR